MERYRYRSAGESNLPVYYPHPRLIEPGAQQTESIGDETQIPKRMDVEHAPEIKERKRSIIDIAAATCNDPNPVSTEVEMRLEEALVDASQYHCDANRMGNALGMFDILFMTLIGGMIC